MPRTSNKFALYIAIGRIVSMLAGFVMPLVLIRYMTQDDYGVFSQFFTIYSAMYLMLAMGIHTNLFYFHSVPEYKDSCVANTIVLLLGACLISGLVFFLPCVQYLVFGDGELSQYGYIVALCVIFAIPMNVISPVFTVREDKWMAMLIPGAIAFARIAVAVAALLLCGSLRSVFEWLLVFQIVVFGGALAYSLHGGGLSLNKELMKQQLAYSLPFGGAVALQLFSNYFDKFVCVRYLTPADYAIYSVAFLSIPGVNQIYDSLCQVNIVNMAKCHQANDKEGLLANYRSFVVKTLSFATPLILSVCVFSEEIMSFLFTEKYVGSAPFFRLYSLTFLVAMFGAGTILRAVGKTNLSMTAFVVTCIIGIPLTIFLVSCYGVYGAIIGALVNIMLPRVIQMVFEYNVLGMALSAFLPWRKLGAILSTGLALVIPLLLAKIWFEPNIFICLVLSCVYVVSAYAVYLNHDMFLISQADFNNRVSTLLHRHKKLN